MTSNIVICPWSVFCCQQPLWLQKSRHLSLSFGFVFFCLSLNFSLQCSFSLTVCRPYLLSLAQYDSIDSTVRGCPDLESTSESLDLSDEWVTFFHLSACLPIVPALKCSFGTFQLILAAGLSCVLHL